MSVEAFSWALSAPFGGSQKIVLLGIANHADPYGRNAYPVLETLARYAYCHRNTARRAVRELVEAGWVVEDGTGPKGQTRYRLPLERGYQIGTPREAPEAGGGYHSSGTGGGTIALVPEPSLEPSLESKSSKSKGGSGGDGDQPTLDPLLEDRVERFLSCHGARVAAKGATPPPKTKAARSAARWILQRERDAKQVLARLDWALDHPFWSGQVLTLPGFRRGWDRLTVQWRASVERDARNGREERTNEPIRPVHYD